MNPYRRRNLVVLCLLSLVLTVSAQAYPRYSVGDPIGFPRIYYPGTRFGDDISAGATITLKCWSTYDYDYDNETCSTVWDGATITWTAKDNYNNDVGTFIDDTGTTAVWIAPTAVGEVRIYATADDDPYYLADDWPQQHYVDFDIVKRAFVKQDAPGAETGGSWYHAFTDLQDALELAGPGWEIWVAQGTYYPGASRSDSFSISGAAIYGGFAGTEGTNDPVGGASILSGDIDQDGLDTDNCYRVVTFSGGTLDGFTIEQGYGDDDPGAGLYVTGSVTLTDCIIQNNETADTGGYGAGAYFRGGSSTVTDCTFTNNTARDDGGGAALVSAGATFSGCTFSSNHSLRLGGDEGEGGDGAGIYIFSSTASFDSTCSFSGNSSGEDGGGASNKTSSATYTNCTFTSNSASDDGGAMCWKDGGNGSVSSTTFTSNSATSNGGAVFISAGDNDGEEPDVGSSPSFSGCTFEYNGSGKDGGAVMSKQAGSDPSYINCDFDHNSAANDGGAIHCEYSSDITVTGGSVTYNDAGDNNGGGIYVTEEASATISGVTIQYNTSVHGAGGQDPDGDGGGICVNKDAHAGVSTCSIRYNQASDQGGGVRVKGGASWSADAYTINNCGGNTPDDIDD